MSLCALHGIPADTVSILYSTHTSDWQALATQEVGGYCSLSNATCGAVQEGFVY